MSFYSTKHSLLAISPDTRFLSSLLFMAGSHDWDVRWARSVAAALDILAQRSIPVVIYDGYSTSAIQDWILSVARLRVTPEEPCVVLAAPQVEEELWCQALEHAVYDVVCRTGQAQHLIATLEFAWKWKSDRRTRKTAARVGGQFIGNLTARQPGKSQ